VDDLGLDALAADGVLAIEWAERLPREDAGAVHVRLEHAGEDSRRITITGG
jgi:tRNA A37 threonylcarbamoyladenosine biosynthesis protein TsaE